MVRTSGAGTLSSTKRVRRRSGPVAVVGVAAMAVGVAAAVAGVAIAAAGAVAGVATVGIAETAATAGNISFSHPLPNDLWLQNRSIFETMHETTEVSHPPPAACPRVCHVGGFDSSVRSAIVVRFRTEGVRW